MEKVLQELFWAHVFGRPYRSKGTKIHLDVALTNLKVYQEYPKSHQNTII